VAEPLGDVEETHAAVRVGEDVFMMRLRFRAGIAARVRRIVKETVPREERLAVERLARTSRIGRLMGGCPRVTSHDQSGAGR